MEGRTARDYEALGWSLVDYEPPPEWLVGVYSGRALVRETGEGCDHTWSPQLVASDREFQRAWSRRHPGYQGRGWKTYSEAHHRLFGPDVDYHAIVMRPGDGEALEDVRDRLAAAIEGLVDARTPKAVVGALRSVAVDLRAWRYEEQ